MWAKKGDCFLGGVFSLGLRFHYCNVPPPSPTLGSVSETIGRALFYSNKSA